MEFIIPEVDGGALELWPSATELRAQADQRTARLAALDPEQLPLALEFLIGYQPRAFDAAANAVEPASPARAPEQEPYCIRCGLPVALFAAHGNDYMHFKGTLTPVSKPRPCRADHKPVVGWRPATDIPAPA